MLKNPNGICLGEYPAEFTQAIEQHWGKLGVLEFIKAHPTLWEELRKVDVYLGKNLSPLVLKEPLSGISEGEFMEFQKMRTAMKDIDNGYSRPIITKKVLIRLSTAWDWRSLVDVLPTLDVHPDQDSINEWVAKALAQVEKDRYAIKYYADSAWVPFDPSDISVWVVNQFDVPIVTATEHPNNDLMYIDQFDGKNAYGSTIHSDTVGKDNYTLASTSGSAWKLNHQAKKARDALNILRNANILSKDIAYQLELGQTYYGQLILFQIKEFARKLPITLQLGRHITMRADKILSGWASDYTLPIIAGMTAWESIEKLDRRRTEEDTFVILWNNSSEANLQPSDFRDFIRGVYHGDAHNGSFVHNSFRFVQHVVQSGWVALLWDRIAGGAFEDGSGVKSLEKMNGGTIEVKSLTEWKIGIEVYGKEKPPVGSLDADGMTKKLSEFIAKWMI